MIGTLDLSAHIPAGLLLSRRNYHQLCIRAAPPPTQPPVPLQAHFGTPLYEHRNMPEDLILCFYDSRALLKCVTYLNAAKGKVNAAHLLRFLAPDIEAELVIEAQLTALLNPC